MSRIALARPSPVIQDSYPAFEQLDGEHPWSQKLPAACVLYRARVLPQGRVHYFNYTLAKEMGLIESNHPEILNADLERQLIDTFSLQIINEYDELTKRRIDPLTIKPKKYMATRYLQLQHSNKRGKTSGDGRGIWNGTVEHQKKIWDVSSRGTGVTCLAPGAVEANRPLKTGTTNFGYGCGQAEIDELYGAAILAETIHLQGIHTERVLCVIDLGRGVGIGVRAAPNLLRPAHLFLLLKQERLEELKIATEYFLDRQIKNKTWIFGRTEASPAKKYNRMLSLLARDFAGFVARMEMDYIFAWLDWDGDNVLANAGIIDYGSVRQFGIRHDAYRYDDVVRFSTTLNEQKNKARQMIQVFCQMVAYLKTGEKRAIGHFANHKVLGDFDAHFEAIRRDRLLYRVGIPERFRKTLLKEHAESVAQFDRIFSHFEKAKIKGKVRKVPDGINLPPLFNMRTFLRVLPEHLQKLGGNWGPAWKEAEFGKSLIKQIHSTFAQATGARADSRDIEKIRHLIKAYLALFQWGVGSSKRQKSAARGLLSEVNRRAQIVNSDTRMTGNALIQIVEILVQEQQGGLPAHGVQKVIDFLIHKSIGMPEVKLSPAYRQWSAQSRDSFGLGGVIDELLEDHFEDI